MISRDIIQETVDNPVIALDIGGVCMHLHPERCIDYFGFTDRTIPAELLDVTTKLEKGQATEEDCFQVFHEATGNKFSNEQLIYGWNLILGDAIEGMPEVAQELCDLGFRFIFFSDTSYVHLLEIYRKLCFAHLVTGGIFSFDAGAQKPDDPMYDLFENTHGKPFFYIDDKPGNIEGGRKHGWQSHQFTSTQRFRDAFFQHLEESIGDV